MRGPESTEPRLSRRRSRRGLLASERPLDPPRGGRQMDEGIGADLRRRKVTSSAPHRPVIVSAR
jgi:hypothetical protein